MVNKAQQADFVYRLTFIKGGKGTPTKHVNRIKKKKKFSTWSMPPQTTGYIKCRAHDFF
jgi:hypothetical protein